MSNLLLILRNFHTIPGWRILQISSLILFFALSARADISFTQTDTYNPTLPAGTVFYATMIHDATTFPDGYLVLGPIDISYEGLKTATIQISTSSATSGITGVTHEIFTSITNNRPATPSDLIVDSTPAHQWITYPLIKSYGVYNFPIYAARYMWIYADTADDVERRIDVGLR